MKRIIILGGLAFLIVIFLANAIAYLYFRVPEFRKVRKGMLQTELISLLGPPYKREQINPQDDAYRIPGYTFSPFRNAGTVYIYIRGDEILYALLENETVIELYIGGS